MGRGFGRRRRRGTERGLNCQKSYGSFREVEEEERHWAGFELSKKLWVGVWAYKAYSVLSVMKFHAIKSGNICKFIQSYGKTSY